MNLIVINVSLTFMALSFIVFLKIPYNFFAINLYWADRKIEEMILIRNFKKL